MPYNPDIHHRHSIRLKEYDYSQEGLYFVTLCCQDMKCCFGKIDNDEMVLNDFGKIAHDEWIKLPERFPTMFSDVFQIMPNHVHSIIALDTHVGATLAVAQNTTVAQNDNMVVHDDAERADIVKAEVNFRATARVAPTIGAIVGAYKSLVFRKILDIYKSRNKYLGKLWQRNYWEHIIRNEKSHQQIADYITTNPANWEKDMFFSNKSS